MHLEKLIDVKFVELKKMSGLLILVHKLQRIIIVTVFYQMNCIKRVITKSDKHLSHGA